MVKKNDMRPDPIIDQIREVRHRISAQFDHDPKRLVEHYIKLQERHADRLVRSTDSEVEDEEKNEDE